MSVRVASSPLLVLLVLTLSLPLSSPAVASPSASFALNGSSDPCRALTCTPFVEVVRPQTGAVTVEVDWDYRGDFTPRSTAQCASASGALDENPLCRVDGPPFRESGRYQVAVQVRDALGATGFDRQSIDIVASAGIRPGTTGTPTDLCGRVRAGERCGPGNGRRTPGGGDKVSHRGWPAVTGVFFKVASRGGTHRYVGSYLNDELLGYDGNDTLLGSAGDDILWGDWRPVPYNPRSQRDRLYGGAGNDFIYSSHGSNRISGGAGNDRIYAHWGHGTIDCGPGRDWLGINHYPVKYRFRHCEKVVQW